MSTRWLGVDWGSTNLRLWAVGDDGTVVETRQGTRGSADLRPDDFERELLDVAGDLLPDAGPIRIVISGMAGARHGWFEAPYRPVPCAPVARGAVQVPCETKGLDVWIVPGLCQSDPADVMRGEETQIAGLLAQKPDFDGMVCLPGTHSKWARVAKGQIAWFQTFMTGELFAFLSEKSVLRHSVGDGWDDAAFATGLSEALDRQDGLVCSLFSIRSGALLHGVSGDAARARLSGLLIGAELSAMQEDWRRHPVAVLGAAGLSRRYEDALIAHSATVTRYEAETLTLTGLAANHAMLEGTP